MRILIVFTLALASASANFPYQVDISQDIDSPYRRCSGSLLGNEWVLTAAHCLRSRESVVVQLGSTMRTQGEVAYTVDKNDIIIHPGYVSFPPRNDIALIKIPFTNYSESIQNVQLPEIAANYSSYEGEKVIASGWGFGSDPELDIVTNLKAFAFNVISNEKCEESFVVIKPNVLCIATNNGISPCIGDGGVPLVLESSKIQIGLMSFLSAAGCKAGRPVAFTRITSFLEWIKSNTNISY